MNEIEQTVGIVTDSSCDLPPQLARELGIEVVPLAMHFGTEVFTDGQLSAEEFWAKAGGSHHPKTSQPPAGAFAEAFERVVARGKQVLCVALTSKHSGTINSAQLAAQRFGEAVAVFDSHSLSLGLGVQALSAAQAARAGHPLPEILTQLEEMRARMRLLILLDTLEYLRLGGRADSFIAVVDRMSRVLNIKAIINVVDGQLRLLSAARSFKAALRRILNLVEDLGPVEHLAVVHTRNQEVANDTADQLAERIGFAREQIWIHETCGVLAVHAGPGVIGTLAVPLPPAADAPAT
jgi:DegV family protein with EDD domain